MKISPLILVVPVMAFGVTVEPLPQSEYADTEVSSNIPFEVSFDVMSGMNFSDLNWAWMNIFQSRSVRKSLLHAWRQSFEEPVRMPVMMYFPPEEL